MNFDMNCFTNNIFKGPYYNTMIVSKISVLDVPQGQMEYRSMLNGQVVKFKCHGFVGDCYKYRMLEDKHNELRNDGGTSSQIGLESERGTT